MVELGDVSTRSELRFNRYIDAIYAAINGEGVILGWQRLISDPLSERRLVRLGESAVTPTERYHVLCPADRRRSSAAKIFTDCLVTQFRMNG